MADFKPAYAIIRKHEGNYVNHKNDKGGETYGGVARKFWPSWSGWAVLDAYKKQGGQLITNMKIDGMEQHLEGFYLKLWDGHRFNLINSQPIANIIYDWMINSGNLGIKKTQEVLRDKFHADVMVDGALGIKTAHYINANHPQDVFFHIKAARIEFYTNLVERKPDQKVFLKGWMSRINSFNYS